MTTSTAHLVQAERSSAAGWADAVGAIGSAVRTGLLMVLLAVITCLLVPVNVVVWIESRLRSR